jgi:hypothetical protein
MTRNCGGVLTSDALKKSVVFPGGGAWMAARSLSRVTLCLVGPYMAGQIGNWLDDVGLLYREGLSRSLVDERRSCRGTCELRRWMLGRFLPVQDHVVATARNFASGLNGCRA